MKAILTVSALTERLLNEPRQTAIAKEFNFNKDLQFMLVCPVVKIVHESFELCGRE